MVDTRYVYVKKVEFSEMKLANGRKVLAITKDKFDKIKTYDYKCGYITNDRMCSECGTSLPFNENGEPVASEDVSHCWFCGAELI